MARHYCARDFFRQMPNRLLARYFRARGVLDDLDIAALDYFFAYPEDYSQHSIEWVDGQFGQRPHHPAFEVVYVYSQAEGSLDLNFRGARTAVQPLQGLFAAAILAWRSASPVPTPARCPTTTSARVNGHSNFPGAVIKNSPTPC